VKGPDIQEFLKKRKGTSLAQGQAAGGLIFTAGSRELLGSRAVSKKSGASWKHEALFFEVRSKKSEVRSPATCLF
jgi:hypothetical protein